MQCIVRTALQGSVTFKAETAGIVHVPIGNINFSDNEIKENLQAVMVKNHLNPMHINYIDVYIYIYDYYLFT